MNSEQPHWKRRIRQLQDKFWRITSKTFNYSQKVRLLPVDFSKPWWHVIWQQKWLALIVTSSMVVDAIVYAILPMFLAWIFTNTSILYLAGFTLIWIISTLYITVALYYYMIFAAQCMYSVSYHAHRYFLTVDPIHHTTKASGKILAKIDRGSAAYEPLLDIITFPLISAIVKIITIIIIFLSYDLKLGLLVATFFATITIISILNKAFIGEGFEKYRIKDDDAFKAIGVENLQANQLIRSSFATTEVNEKLERRSHNIMATFSNLWMAHVSLDMFIRFLYIITIMILLLVLFYLHTQGNMDVALGIALMVTYVNSSQSVIYIGNDTRQLVEQLTRVNDLFAFIRNFGKQTYPVLNDATMGLKSTFPGKDDGVQTITADAKEESKVPPTNKTKKTPDTASITLHISDLHFDYGEKTRLFEGHSLNMKIARNQKNKLYGIIGKSGSGKTTLLSILGGQLNPSRGTVAINGIDLYTSSDEERRSLIALQMQTASSLRGELKYNLLFGLPGNIEPTYIDLAPDDTDYHAVMELVHAEQNQTGASEAVLYSNEQLITTLSRVGLWDIFKDKEGLDTLIGEGGLNLSGGQRQRLNFASLYLRAKYFRPSVVLIDEPTSSLDEISEQAITSMILDMASEAITIVIAHRLKTLDDAVGILDFSLIGQDKTLTFSTKEYLAEHSHYYQQLITGEVSLDG